MTKQQCQTCMKWFEDSDLDGHLLEHLEDKSEGQSEEETGQLQLKCPLCGGTNFDRESGTIEGSWGQSNHKLVLMVCRKCLLTMPFHEGRTIFGGVTLKQKKLDTRGLPQVGKEN